MKRFVVLLKSETPAQATAFVERIKGKGYWHRTPNTWLITDKANTLTAASLRDIIKETHANVHCLVLELAAGGTWAGYGPAKEPNDMFKWVQNTWRTG